MKISEIAAYLEQKTGLAEEVLVALAGDTRRGVQELLKRYYRLRKAGEDEINRLEIMLTEEKVLWGKGLTRIAGVDEAGRGPLAGPVVAAAVIFQPGSAIKHLNDSKQLSPKRREQLFDEIILTSQDYGIGSASSAEINHLNIHQASFLAMRRALDKMNKEPEYILVDGFLIPGYHSFQKAIVRGDSRSLSIAAASVLAKVSRDRIMLKLHDIYPNYAFNSNKGYGTIEHRQAIVKFGMTPEHRNSFKLRDIY